jgi:hypothetical protein
MITRPRPASHDELEALIKEARARQLRRRLLGAAGVAIAAAVGLSVYALVSGGAARSGTVSRGGPVAAAAPCGVASGWRLKLAGSWSEPTGQHTAPLAVTRTGASACTLSGYPTVALLDAQGNRIAFRFSHRGDMVVAARPPRTVRVSGHGSAFFLLNKYRCDARDTALARWLRVTLPGIRGRLLLRLPHYPMLDYCPVTGPSTTVAVSPIVAKLSQAAARLP